MGMYTGTLYVAYMNALPKRLEQVDQGETECHKVFEFVAIYLRYKSTHCQMEIVLGFI